MKTRTLLQTIDLEVDGVITRVEILGKDDGGFDSIFYTKVKTVMPLPPAHQRAAGVPGEYWCAYATHSQPSTAGMESVIEAAKKHLHDSIQNLADVV